MSTDVLKIDIHTHILPETWPDLHKRYGYGGWVSLDHHRPCCARMLIDDRAFREITSSSWDPATRIGDCDRTGVNVQVLSTVPIMFSYWAKPADALDLARRLNDHIASVVREHPSRFAGLGTLPMQSPELAIRELERCTGELGLAGVEIGSHVNDWNLDAPEVFAVFEAAERLGAAVFVHPWDMCGNDEMPKYWLPWLVGMPAETTRAICSMIFGGVLERLPDLRVAFAHGGGAFPYTLGRIEHGFRVRPDICAVENDVEPRAYIGRFYVDSLVHDPDALRFLVNLIGAERIALGSDYPFPLGEPEPGRLIESIPEFSAKTKKRLLAGTALEFLGLTADAFLPRVLGDDPLMQKTTPDLEHARRLDADDDLRDLRAEFAIPTRADGAPVVYLCGNSLGLQPRGARAIVEQEMRDWAELAVDAHFDGATPWYSYHETLRAGMERVVGAKPGAGEVVMMNSLTVNLHLMMVSFYRPAAGRYRILIEWPAFPSDVYAVKTHLATRGQDPDDALIIVRPRDGEESVRPGDLEAAIARDGETIALVMLGGVNFLTGQVFDMERIARLAHAQGATVGFDLAHAAGNVELKLHDWNVDFACWCTYKYLNGGPGAVAGCFVHERHARDVDLPRYGGWWGNDPATRFRMHLEPDFVAAPNADGWQLSNPPILAMAPLRASLSLFDRAGMTALRAKSVRLTGYLRTLIEDRAPDGFEIITPRDPAAHGCQLSILVRDQPRERFRALQEAGVVGDFREPNVIRVAPAPLYNSFEDAWRFAEILTEAR